MGARNGRPTRLLSRLLHGLLAFAVFAEVTAAQEDASQRLEQIPKPPGVDWAENLRRANFATVTVSCSRKEGSRRIRSSGAGVVVSGSGYLLTASHLVEGYDRIEVQTVYRPDTLEAEVAYFEPEYDLALLKVAAPEPLEAATLASAQSVVEGRPAFVIGNPFGEGQTVRSGEVGDAQIVNWEGHRAQMRAVHAVVLNGNSGGGTFDLETGELLGINVAKSRSNCTGYMVSVDRLREILNEKLAIEELIDSELIHAELGVRLRRVNLLEGRFRRGMLVTAVTPGSIAHRAGWKRGDILIGLDRYQMINRDAVLYVLLDASRNHSEVRVLKFRDGEEDWGRIELPSYASIAATGIDITAPPPRLDRGF